MGGGVSALRPQARPRLAGLAAAGIRPPPHLVLWLEQEGHLRVDSLPPDAPQGHQPEENLPPKVGGSSVPALGPFYPPVQKRLPEGGLFVCGSRFN
jgi:hypothetical protein